MILLKKIAKTILIIIFVIVVIAVLFMKLWQPFGQGINDNDKSYISEKQNYFMMGLSMVILKYQS